jgi:hypothetical protein
MISMGWKFPWKFPLTAWPHPEACEWAMNSWLNEVWQGGHSTTVPVFERRFENRTIWQMSVSENRVYNSYIYTEYTLHFWQFALG